VSVAPTVSVAPVASTAIDGSGPLTLADAGKNDREDRAREQRDRISRALQIQAEQMAKALTDSTPRTDGVLSAKQENFDLASALSDLPRDAGGGGSLRAGRASGGGSLRGLSDLDRDH